jgi:predicted TIM-barrel fold metal-dependent hydrolase
VTVTDAHFHVWRQADLPWLTGPMQPRIFGPYQAIRRDYPIAEYLGDIAGTGVSKAVYVQANWPPDRAVAEADWIAARHAETGWPHAAVAFADMTDPDAARRLDRLAENALVRGIRHQLHWHQVPEYRFAPHDDLCRDATVQRNVARLADYGFVFELQVFAPQMTGAAEMARACPRTTLVLQHAGMLEDRSADGRAAWRAAMAALAAQPNVVAKLSGFGTFLHRRDPDHIAWLTEETVALFGAERCLWGSNYPIEKLWTDYASLLDAHRAATRHLPPEARAAIFDDTATRVYRLT